MESCIADHSLFSYHNFCLPCVRALLCGTFQERSLLRINGTTTYSNISLRILLPLSVFVQSSAFWAGVPLLHTTTSQHRAQHYRQEEGHADTNEPQTERPHEG